MKYTKNLYKKDGANKPRIFYLLFIIFLNYQKYLIYFEHIFHKLIFICNLLHF